MPQEKFKSDVVDAIECALEAGITPAAIARLLRRTLYTVDMVAGWDKPTSTPAHSGPSRVAQCL